MPALGTVPPTGWFGTIPSAWSQWYRKMVACDSWEIKRGKSPIGTFCRFNLRATPIERWGEVPDYAQRRKPASRSKALCAATLRHASKHRSTPKSFYQSDVVKKRRLELKLSQHP